MLWGPGSCGGRRGKCVNSGRENFSLQCELMGLPGVRLQLRAALETSGVDRTKVSRFLLGTKTQRSGFGPEETPSVLCAWGLISLSPWKMLPHASSYQKAASFDVPTPRLWERGYVNRRAQYTTQKGISGFQITSRGFVLGTKWRAPSFPLLAGGTWHLVMNNTLELVSS